MVGPRRGMLRAGAAIAAVSALAIVLTACSPLDTALPRVVRTSVSSVMPYEPSNSVQYSSAVLRAKRPFARWEDDRRSIELVTWPASCSKVPLELSFVSGGSTVQVGTGPAPRSDGSRQCEAGAVLTSTFAASRLLRRDRTTTLDLHGASVLLPPAPALALARVGSDVEAPDRVRPLHEVTGALPVDDDGDGDVELTTSIRTGWSVMPTATVRVFE